MAVFTTYDDDHDQNGTEHLYIGTFNTETGCELWRSANPSTSAGSWEQVNYDGFGNAHNICVMAMIVFKGELYAGTYNREGNFGGSNDETTWSAGRIFRYAHDADVQKWDSVWDGVVGGSGTEEDPYCYALSADCFSVFDTTDLDDEDDLWVGLFHLSGDDLYASSTGDSGDWYGQGNVQSGYVNAIVDLIVYDGYLHASTSRKDHRYVFRTPDGSSWEQRSRNSFGDDYNKSIYCFGLFGGDLYAATWNTETTFGAENGTGCEVWKTTADATYITLESFEAVARKDGAILLHWETGTEIGTAGFDLYRSESPDFESFEKVTPRMVEPTGSPVAGAEYSVLDRSVKPGTLYYYFLVEIDVNGKMDTFGPVQARAKIPVAEKFEMYSAIIQMDTFGV